LARAVADAVLRYRIEHELSQRALAAALGMKPSVVARLELAEHNPSIETLERLASALGIRFVVDVAPVARRDQQAAPPGLTVVQDVTGQSGGRLLVAAG
jgi:transcriptional regulator with XRE-family HTH domain